MWARRDAGAGLGDGARTRFPTMHRRRLRNPLFWSPIVALAAQLFLTAVTAAATGGGDFPRIRVLVTGL
jgi:hypothetical protein